jgi:ABC-type amino acid transport substrate-binding protein
MEINEKLNYVFVTKDPALEKKLLIAFTTYESYVSLKSYDTVLLYLEHKKVDAIIFDESVLTDIGSTKSNIELLQDVYNKTLIKNHKTIFILLAKKHRHSQKN